MKSGIRLGPWHSWVLMSIQVVACANLVLMAPQPIRAGVFTCSSGDVDCLVDAIQVANANGGKDVIRLAPGLYTLTVVDNDTDGPNGLPSISSNITIKGVGAIIEGPGLQGGLSSFRILHVAETGNLKIVRLTIRRGFPPSRPQGGGIRNYGTLTIIRSTISDNDADMGGGLWNAESGTVTIVNSTIGNNNSGKFGGGGIHNSGSITITRSTISDNIGDPAGGLLNTLTGLVTIKRSTFENNRFGGGIVNRGKMTLTRSFVLNNEQSISLAGGIENFGDLTINRSFIAGNKSAGPGAGGIGNFDGGNVIIHRSVVTGNETRDAGGGISNSGNMSIHRSVVAGNEAGNFAGGILNDGTLTLERTVVAGNVPDDCFGCD